MKSSNRNKWLVLSVLAMLLANFIWVSRTHSIIESDMRFLAAHCERLAVSTEAAPAKILIADRGADGILYLTGPEWAGKGFEVGFRSVQSELFCTPLLGCIAQPVMAAICNEKSAP